MSKQQQMHEFIRNKTIDAFKSAITLAIINKDIAKAQLLASYMDEIKASVAHEMCYGYGWLELCDIMGWKTRRVSGR